VRDADVMIASISQLSERFAGQLPATTFQAIRAHLEARRSAQSGQADGAVVDGRAVHELRAARLPLA